MNVKFCENQVCFKVSHKELKTLTQTGELIHSIQLTEDYLFSYKIIVDDLVPDIQLNFSAEGLILILAPDILNASKKDILFSKQGISKIIKFNSLQNLNVIFQVDVLSKSKLKIKQHCE